MATKKILIVPGDGIGQEVTSVGKKVLDKIAEKFGHTFSYDEALMIPWSRHGGVKSRIYLAFFVWL